MDALLQIRERTKIVTQLLQPDVRLALQTLPNLGDHRIDPTQRSRLFVLHTNLHDSLPILADKPIPFCLATPLQYHPSAAKRNPIPGMDPQRDPTAEPWRSEPSNGYENQCLARPQSHRL